MISRALIFTAACLFTPGMAAASWMPDGNPVCISHPGMNVPSLASDGAGGAIIAWYDGRNSATSGTDIYAQHILSSGGIDPAWPAEGALLCNASGDQYAPRLVPDGAGGAFVVWEDFRGDGDIYAQHVLSTGSLDAAYPADGRAVCAALEYQSEPLIVSDGAGGAFIAWTDSRVVDNDNVYAHHILGSGALDSRWDTDGTVLCNAASYQNVTALVSDGAGGMIAVWHDDRGADRNIYAVRMQANGTRASGWPSNGKAVCSAAGDQADAVAVSDGAGGAIVVWEDLRSDYSVDVYAQHMKSNGALDNAWPSADLALATTDDADFGPRVTSDGSGGAFVVWVTGPAIGPGYQLMASHVLGSGGLHATWPSGGTPVCNTVYYPVRIVPDGTGGAILVWQDTRGPFGIVAHHLLASGVDPAWFTNGVGISGGVIDRAYPDLINDGANGGIATWVKPSSGIYAGYVPVSGVITGVVSTGAPTGLRLGPPHPQPLIHGASLALDLPIESAVIADVLDVSGRVVRRVASGETMPAGRHEIAWDGRDARGEVVRGGVYFLRVVTAAGSASQRIVALAAH